MILLPPAENPLCLGHESFLEKFQGAQEKGRLPHGWLLCGPHGVGKRTAAYTLIRSLFGEGRILNPQDPLFRRIALESHGDFFVLKGTHVEAVREISHFLRKAPVEGLFRLVLIPEVDHLTLNASNALLKILEEPAAHTFFFLTAQNLGNVLSTVRSRCRLVRLSPPPSFEIFSDHLYKLCEAQGISFPSPSVQEILWDLTKGCLGKALALLAENTFAQVSLFKELIETAFLKEADKEFQMPFQAAHLTFWAGVSKDWFREQLLTWLEDLVVRGSQGQLRAACEKALFSQRDLLAWGALYEALSHFLREAQTFNLDTIQTVAVALSFFRKRF